MAINGVRDVTDIIALEGLQHIQDSLGRVTKITTAILAPNGVPVTQPTNLHAFCQIMQQSEAGIAMCLKTNSRLIAENKKTRKPSTLICPSSHLMTAAIPIFLGDEYLGSWLIGQLRTDTLDLSLIERTSKAAGLSAEEAKRSIALLPVISEKEFDSILQFLQVFTEAITWLARTNDQLNKKNQELIELTALLNHSAQAFREFIDLSDVGVYLVDIETGNIIMCNSVYANFIGQQSIPDLIGKRCYNLLGYGDWCPFCPRDTLAQAGEAAREPVHWENHLEEFGVWLGITTRAIRWIDGRDALMITFVDITERKSQEERTAYIAYYDQRLNIPNGMKLVSDLNSSEAGAYVICFDILGLRKTNEAYGREAGDLLLKSICDWVADGNGGGSTPYRVDGDAFAVHMHSAQDQTAMALARRIYDRFSEPWTFPLGGVMQKLYVGVTMGVLRCMDEYMEYPEFLNRMERVLEIARGKNTLAFYDEAADRAHRANLQLELCLQKCVLNRMEGFSLLYQPIVDARSGRFAGVEALCRWNCPDHGPKSPIEFIPKAEQLGLINILGEWVLRRAISDMKRFRLDCLEGFFLDVNLSPLQLNDRELPRTVAKALLEYDFPPKRLSLEVTESAEIHFSTAVTKALRALRRIGVSLSLDDFGTGYASFSALRNLPVEIVKTDRSFITALEEDDQQQLTYRVIVDFAHASGKKLVAEGVETEKQRDILKRLGVDFIQGYLYARPLSFEELARVIHQFQS